MADCKITFTEICFRITETATICIVGIDSSEPDNPFWGNGLRTCAFHPSIPLEEILKEYIGDNELKYLQWKKITPEQRNNILNLPNIKFTENK